MKSFITFSEFEKELEEHPEKFPPAVCNGTHIRHCDCTLEGNECCRCKATIQKNKEMNIPVLNGRYRKDFPKGIEVWCNFCNKWHRHGIGEGHRVAHCHSEKSPYARTGYIIKLMKGQTACKSSTKKK